MHRTSRDCQNQKIKYQQKRTLQKRDLQRKLLNGIRKPYCLHRFKTEIQRTAPLNPSVSDINIILTSRITSEFKLVPWSLWRKVCRLEQNQMWQIVTANEAHSQDCHRVLPLAREGPGVRFNWAWPVVGRNKGGGAVPQCSNQRQRAKAIHQSGSGDGTSKFT